MISEFQHVLKQSTNILIHIGMISFVIKPPIEKKIYEEFLTFYIQKKKLAGNMARTACQSQDSRIWEMNDSQEFMKDVNFIFLFFLLTCITFLKHNLFLKGHIEL